MLQLFPSTTDAAPGQKQGLKCSVVLKVEAEASTETRPLEGFTPRKGEGIFLFGKSKTDPPAEPNMRIDFQFDTAAFDIRCMHVICKPCGFDAQHPNAEYCQVAAYTVH